MNMDVEKIAWAAVSGAVLVIFWPWLLAQRMLAVCLDDESNRQD